MNFLSKKETAPVKESFNPRPFKIVIKYKDLLKFDYINTKYNLEFTGLMHCTRDKKNVYRMEGMFFPKQENGAAVTKFEAEDLMEMCAEKKDEIRYKDLRGHIH